MWYISCISAYELHRCQRSIVLLDLACHGILFNQIKLQCSPLFSWQWYKLSPLLLSATTSALKKREQVVLSRQQDSRLKHTLVKHTSAVWAQRFLWHTSKLYNTQLDWGRCHVPPSNSVAWASHNSAMVCPAEAICIVLSIAEPKGSICRQTCKLATQPAYTSGCKLSKFIAVWPYRYN